MITCFLFKGWYTYRNGLQWITAIGCKPSSGDIKIFNVNAYPLENVK